MQCLQTTHAFDYITFRINPGLTSCKDLATVVDISLDNNYSACSASYVLPYRPLSVLNLKINTLVSLLGNLIQAPFWQAKYKRVIVEMQCFRVFLCSMQDFCCLTNCQCRRSSFCCNAVYQECMHYEALFRLPANQNHSIEWIAVIIIGHPQKAQDLALIILQLVSFYANIAIVQPEIYFQGGFPKFLGILIISVSFPF